MSELEKNKPKQTVFREDVNHDESPPSKPAAGPTSSGLEENVAGLLCYLLGFITGILFILIEKENRFVRFHAFQSIFTFAGIFVLTFVLNIIPILGLLVSIILTPAAIILWIILMVQACQGKKFKLPIVGDLAEKQVK